MTEPVNVSVNGIEINVELNPMRDYHEIDVYLSNGDIDAQLITYFNENKWHTTIKNNIMGEMKGVGSKLKSTNPIWVLDNRRDPQIRNMLENIGLVKGNKEKGKLFNRIIDSISDENREGAQGVFLNMEREMPVGFEYIPNVTMKGIIEKMKDNYHLSDTTYIVVALSTAITKYLTGDPVWVLIVMPPSGGKTVILSTMVPDGLPNLMAHPISSITPNTFLSGLKENIDLLPRLNGKIVVMKDFTTILTKNKDTKNEILGQFREIYDRCFNVETGSGIGSKGSDSKITVLAAVTPMIDKQYSFESLLGERFIRVRVHGEMNDDVSNQFRDNITKVAIHNQGTEDNVKKELSNMVLSLIQDFEEYSKDGFDPDMSDDVSILLQDCAKITATLRTYISRDRFGDVEDLPEPEYAARLVKQYKKLAGAISWTLNKKEIDYECVSYIYRIALDSVKNIRVITLKSTKSYEPHTGKEISLEVGIPHKTTMRNLEDLLMLNMVRKVNKDDFDDVKVIKPPIKKDDDKAHIKINPDGGPKIPNVEETVNSMQQQEEEEEAKSAHYWVYNNDSPTIKSIFNVEDTLKEKLKPDEMHHNLVGLKKF